MQGIIRNHLLPGEGYTGLYVNPLMKEHEGKKVIDEVTGSALPNQEKREL